MSFDANVRVKERCMICEGGGRKPDSPQNGGRGSGLSCHYCGGTGVVFARTGQPKEILMATGDCKIPMKKINARA